MRKRVFLVSILILVILLILVYFMGNSRNNINGTYVVDGVVYLSPLSSESKDYFEAKRKDTIFVISKDNFTYDSSDIKVDIKNPTYRKERMDEEITKNFNESVFHTISLSDYKDKYQYTIYDSDKAVYRIYSLDTETWIAAYSETPDGKYYIIDILKVKKK
ncbi:MAG TPA: hypothetical protein VHP81_13165 [Lachnospiraceae bacterium]|nr:hypothetical protein [Lachnospiraceae bacterium]